MLGCLANCAETTHQKSDGHRPACNVRAIDRQLESICIGAEDYVLATASIDEDVLEARQGCEKNVLIFAGRDLNRLGDGREHGRAGLWQPDVTGLQSGEGRIGKSNRAPTLQQAAQAPASA